MKIDRRPDRMLPRALAILGTFCLCDCSVQKDQKETERYILESERQWADSVATGDTVAIERILADDFVGVDPKGRPLQQATDGRRHPERAKVLRFESTQ